MASNYIIQLPASGVQAGPHSYLGPLTERLSVPDPQELPSWYKFSSPYEAEKEIVHAINTVSVRPTTNTSFTPEYKRNLIKRLQSAQVLQLA